MKQKSRVPAIICILILIAAAGVGGFFLGKNKEAERFQEETNLNIQLNRSDLKEMEEIEGTIYVTGHKSPDSVIYWMLRDWKHRNYWRMPRV